MCFVPRRDDHRTLGRRGERRLTECEHGVAASGPSHAERRPVALDALASRVFAPLAADTPHASTPTAAASFAITKASVERGASLFVVKGCVLCHGQRAEGQFGPRIARTVLPFDDVKRQARTPRNIYMPAFTQPLLAEDELVDIYVFLQSLPAE